MWVNEGVGGQANTCSVRMVRDEWADGLQIWLGGFYHITTRGMPVGIIDLDQDLQCCPALIMHDWVVQ